MILLCQNNKIGNNKSSLSLAQGYACLTFLNLCQAVLFPKPQQGYKSLRYSCIYKIQTCAYNSYKVFKVGITPQWNTLYMKQLQVLIPYTNKNIWGSLNKNQGTLASYGEAPSCPIHSTEIQRSKCFYEAKVLLRLLKKSFVQYISTDLSEFGLASTSA